ncbi:type IV pilus inner membrane component PilO [Geomonas subterranea]|uniref:Type 4a pilus biogenesis protein PilO n=1 Tax=Geomonas subterranea TaxID=2847989 RepID=A0ABX8LKP7_9BACT|nr:MULTISPECIES: type 4a pilus biogenesis protein PilO [Geomonas]QXE91486.1 type 4a pilus biogenesis protein PilO [Geomonas subterranea]QXM10426.1 type 4a pilus biogenesis protein PilO [Geomonas subterranea]
MDPQIEKLLKLPTKQKVALLILLLLLEGAGIYYGLLRPRIQEQNELKTRHEELQKQIEENRRIANNLPRFKAEYEQLKRDLDNALTELPNQKEIPSLLTSISNVGKGAGLDFLLFRPKPEVPKDFYAEVPVDISVSGTFFNVADFFVAVGKLPRIVNINNVNFTDIKESGGRTTLKVNCLATTFRFLDAKEAKNANAKKPK